MSEERALVCYVGGAPYYGGPAEAAAVKLKPGDAVEIADRPGTKGGPGLVKCVWFYDGLVVDLQDGRRFRPEMDPFTVLEPGAYTPFLGDGI